ncbi:hypothetical protein ACFWOJ_19725 [Streptomyces sp. NPDC058439]|uniref:hypothetical protein n=1 Tax=Streptomyces sp. NPDC058439 TaxID=3346500 RepID=UPI00365F90CE
MEIPRDRTPRIGPTLELGKDPVPWQLGYERVGDNNLVYLMTESAGNQEFHRRPRPSAADNYR